MTASAPASTSGTPVGTPDADVHIETAVVRALLRDQHPDLAELPLRRLEAGWDNQLFRLGDRLAIRLPRRTASAGLIVHEQRWLGLLAGRLPLPIPAPVRVGEPGQGFPWHWSVIPWFTGVPAFQEAPSEGQGRVLARFLRALHIEPPTDAPTNPYRGVPLSTRASVIEERLARLAQMPIVTPEIRAMWEQALASPVDVAPTWIHGDLHVLNVLVDDGRLSAVIDWGDMAAGDPATDLASIWMLLPTRALRAEAIDAYGPASAATWSRARGWVVAFATMMLDAGLAGDARFAAMGEQVMRHLADGP